jgi:AraC-like DNA-binding protein
MPIFMDRHDVSESVTAEIVADLHQRDLKIQHRFGCRGLTYWFDDKRKTAFCLIEGPDSNAIRQMHRESHGDIPHSIIEVEASIVESFLGRIGDPEKARDTALNIINDPAFRTIMFLSLDQLAITGSDFLPDNLLHRRLQHGIQETLKAFEGNTVEQTGFHYLISFRSVTNAIHAALEIQLLGKPAGKNRGKPWIGLRIGLSAGVPVTNKQLIFEDTIKSAGRLSAIAGGDIVVSSEVWDLYKSENPKSAVKKKGIRPLSETEEVFVAHLMDFTDKHSSNTNLKVADFCKPVGSSKAQFYRKLIALTGKSPNTFIKDYRLKEALKLLRKKGGNISEIAFETGFSSPSYFSKCFQKKYGYYPSGFLRAGFDG